ncbi:C6 finger domain-containing protein [Fusarium circinatum]|uniref:C6 finger domain-containing protein n=1 Tax=Fusarium circinatum TaxID=48490 RepID=A0A8H5X6U9_FUSCI|nr:C6 finger domain-containing protein [Fusarium circinatum]
MCSTTQSDNGLWQGLPAVALSMNDASTEALFYSMLAISGHHRWGPGAADPFKAKAVQALTRSLIHTNSHSQERLLGCSPDVFNAIRHINILRANILPQTDVPVPTDTIEHRSALEAQLLSAEQHLSRDESTCLVHQNSTEALAKAELYRLAALLYLQRVVPEDGDEDRREAYVQQALSIMSGLTVASSPWPCFIVACEVTLEEQRLQILEVLYKMDTVRKIGNMLVGGLARIYLARI